MILGFDWHCHIDLYKNAGGVLKDVQESAIQTFAVTTTPLAFEGNVQRFGGSSLIKIGLGLHPELAHTSHAKFEIFRNLIDDTDYIGEIGLDKRQKNKATFSDQLLMFDAALKAVREAKRPKILSVHSAGAVTAVLDKLELLASTRSKTIMHWFTGTLAELRRAVDLGCYFSVNQAMLGNDRGARLIREIPVMRLLTETDGPFTSVLGREAMPSDVLVVVDNIAKSRLLRKEELLKILARNAADLTAEL